MSIPDAAVYNEQPRPLCGLVWPRPPRLTRYVELQQWAHCASGDVYSRCRVIRATKALVRSSLAPYSSSHTLRRATTFGPALVSHATSSYNSGHTVRVAMSIPDAALYNEKPRPFCGLVWPRPARLTRYVELQQWAHCAIGDVYSRCRVIRATKALVRSSLALPSSSHTLRRATTVGTLCEWRCLFQMPRYTMCNQGPWAV
ncbi:hypothetical protein J6590_049083 [Homalodisca vitripennis]|nr:hypothetical protein J6590_049083 [Homalodisca vitripennis]